MNQEQQIVTDTIKLTLIKMGIRCDLKGFAYFCYATELTLKNPEIIHHLCDGVYAEVGKKFNVEKRESVERAMRHAITTTYQTKGFSHINEMFKIEIFNRYEKPTVGEFLSLCSEYCRATLNNSMHILQFMK